MNINLLTRTLTSVALAASLVGLPAAAQSSAPLMGEALAMSVRENLVMAARRSEKGADDWTLERVLQIFPRLAERLGNQGNQLSGGEQQMLAIGRALMTQPQLIILDEATEGLAPLIVAEIWRVLGTIRTSGIATLIVDRDYRKVLARLDQALVLQKGQVVLSGRSADVVASAELAGFLGV